MNRLDYVDLDRRFRDLKSDAPEESALLALVGHDEMGSLNWATLLRSKRVLMLAEAGSARERILSATVYLRDIADFAAMNEVWEAWLPVGAAPARTTVEARLAVPELRVEITVVAAAA